MKYIILPALLLMLVATESKAQDSTREKFNELINEKHYVFVPDNITAGNGTTRQLNNGDFFLKLNVDTLISYLPYFGVAYSAPLDSKDNGYDFTTTNFSYTMSTCKKNTYNISIKTKDKVYNADFLLKVYDNVTAYLQVISGERQTVSYHGRIVLNN